MSMDFYADDAAERLQEFAFDRRKAKRYGVPAYQLKRHGTSRLVAYVKWSRDCDCSESSYIVILPATMAAINERIDHDHEWADGPFSYTPVPLKDAVEFEGWTRDRAAEAFENGHPYAIYDDADDNNW